MSKHKSYTPEFKAKVVLEALQDQRTAAQICRENGYRRTGTVSGPIHLGADSGKKSPQSADLSLARRWEIVTMLRHEFSVNLLCAVLGLARSSFYYHPHPADDLTLRSAMEVIALEFPRYGYRRITPELKGRGWEVNHKRVLRLMRQENLLVEVKRYCRTTL